MSRLSIVTVLSSFWIDFSAKNREQASGPRMVRRDVFGFGSKTVYSIIMYCVAVHFVRNVI